MGEAGCRLCPRLCGADRAAGARGFCGAGAQAEVYRAGAHHGEEPPLSGTHGSGAVFFSRCTLRCLYCQNHPWSRGGAGRAVDTEGLAGILRALRREGCHNWNLVSPTPWIPMIRAALTRLRSEGIRLPVVYNTSGFERRETLEALADLVDVYLPDLRYARAETAAAGSGRADYVTVAREAFRTMWAQKGALRRDKNGVALSGVICRILVLPNHADEAVATLRWLADTTGAEVAVSVMAQYTPAHEAPGRPGWDRRITRAEYDRVRAAVDSLGFTDGWVQAYHGPTQPELLGYAMKPGFGPTGREA
jgi:putative pyruvate formate lyase activating enzyme